jgi:hypothetical protein
MMDEATVSEESAQQKGEEKNPKHFKKWREQWMTFVRSDENVHL